jgi:hypothetical protein
VKVSSDEDGMFVIWFIEKEIKENVTRWKYWVNPYFNKSNELGSFVVARELHQYIKKNQSIFYETTEETLKFCHRLNHQDLSSSRKWDVSQPSPQV